MSELQAINSVYNIEIEKIDPNPNQPRKYFDEESLRDLAESIRRYGVMQPITVFRREQETSGGITTRYEIIAGERRWRASIQAGMSTIPAIIHDGQETEQDRFELSILENLQREDLNPVDKARSFARLADEFGMKHAEIADRLGKSREYVTNAMRLLVLPDNVLEALSAGEINEGHTRPLLVLKDSPDELQTLFVEITTKGLTVREAETVARKLSGKHSKPSRHKLSQHSLDPEMQELQAQLAHSLGTSVSIDKKEEGGKLTIDFFSRDELKKLLAVVNTAGTPPIAAGTTELSASESALPAGTQVEDLSQSNSIATTQDKTFPEAHVAEETITKPEILASGATILHEEIVGPAQQTNQWPTSDELIDSGVSTEANLSAYNTELDIIPRGDALQLDESLAGKSIIEQSAYQAEPSPSVIGQSHLVSDRARELQKEIDALAQETTPEEVAMFTERTEVDLGELAITKPQINQDFNTAPVRAPGLSQGDQPGFSQGAPSHAHVHSAAVSNTTDSFIPPDREGPPMGQVQGGISGGSEFVPHGHSTDTPPDNQSTMSSSAEITMGGLDGSMAQTSDRPFAPANNTTSTKSAEKYPDGDPYRLDNFSV